MTLQWGGAVLAVITVLTISLGHVFVRRANYHYGTKPGPFVLVFGVMFLAISLLVSDQLLSAVFGIIGVTTVWDGIEFYRQEKRIRRGHAPENPARPVQQEESPAN